MPPEPVGLELKLLRHLIAHPQLTLEIDEPALLAFESLGPESFERLSLMVVTGHSLGEGATFAAMSQQLKLITDEFDVLIGEIASMPESDFDSVRLEFRSFVRQIKMDMLKNELKTLFSSGLTSDQMGIRYREINALQDQLMREAQEEMAPR